MFKIPENIATVYYKTASFQKEAMRTQVGYIFFYEVKFVWSSIFVFE